MSSIRGNAYWFEFLNNASRICVDNPADEELRLISTIASAATRTNEYIKQRSWEEDVLFFASRQLLELRVSDGWPAKRMVTDLTQKSAAHLTELGIPEGTEKVRAWSEQSIRVLDNDAPLPPLRDDGSIVLRALLLLLVRESTDSLLALRASGNDERVGDKVWRLAFVLAAFHEGLRGLPKKLKYEGSVKQARARLEFFGEIVHLWALSLTSGATTAASGLASIDEFNDDGLSYIGLSWKNHRILARPMDVSPALTKAAGDCRFYGYSVSKVMGDHFEVSGGTEEQLDTKVQVSVWHDPKMGAEIVRFKAIAVSFATKSASQFADPVKALQTNRQLSKVNLISMLLSNGDESQNCRLALQANPPAIVVLVDQMLNTMDREECVAHLRNVSKRARVFAQSPRRRQTNPRLSKT
jgi:hypothetical protein